MIFIDTNIAIAIREADEATLRKMEELTDRPVISVITRIELESGVFRNAAHAEWRRKLLDEFLATVPVEMFAHTDILAYGNIVRDHGIDRQRTLDRLIAAQAISRDAPLVTGNGRDFRRIDGLKLVEW